MNTPQNPSESAVQIGKIVISIIPTIRTFSYIFVPIRNSRFSSDSHFFVLFCVRMGDKPCIESRNLTVPQLFNNNHVPHVWVFIWAIDSCMVQGGSQGCWSSTAWCNWQRRAVGSCRVLQPPGRYHPCRPATTDA